MTTPRLSILMSALRHRQRLRADVEPHILRQIAALPDPSAVEFLLEEDAGGTPSGVKRNRLTSRATGDYIAFVDDDDRVSDDYIAQLLTGIKSGADVVTFQLHFVRETARQPLLWEFRLFSKDHQKMPSGGKSMTANHLCAWRRQLAASVPWLPIGYMDDCFWYRGLIATGGPKTEHHIARVLYHYVFRWSVTANQTSRAKQHTRRSTSGGTDYFWWNRPTGRIVAIGAGGRNVARHKREIEVFIPGGERATAPVDELERFYDIKL